MKKIFYVLIGLGLLLLPIVAYATNITVPSAPSAGYALVSTSTGAYIATTTSPFHVGSIFASSTNATSTFAYSIQSPCFTGDGITCGIASSTLLQDTNLWSGTSNTYSGNIIVGAPVGVGLIEVTTATNGTGITIGGVTTGNAFSVTSLTSGNAINATCTGCVVANYNTTSAAQTIGSVVTATGASNMTVNRTGAYIVVTPTRNLAAAATRVESGGAEQLNLTYTISGALASILNATATTSWIGRTLSNSGSNASALITTSAPIVDFHEDGSGPGIASTGDGVRIEMNIASSSGTALNVTHAGVGNLALFNGGNGKVGIGTTTPQFELTLASTTAPQLSLSAGAGQSQWTFRNAFGTLYLATSTLAGTATTTTSALSISGTNGNVSIGSLSSTTQMNLIDSTTHALGGVGGINAYFGDSVVNNSNSLIYSYKSGSTAGAAAAFGFGSYIDAGGTSRCYNTISNCWQWKTDNRDFAGADNSPMSFHEIDRNTTDNTYLTINSSGNTPAGAVIVAKSLEIQGDAAASAVSILDKNNNPAINIQATGSAINYLNVQNNSSGNDVIITATSTTSGANVGFQMRSLNFGGITVRPGKDFGDAYKVTTGSTNAIVERYDTTNGHVFSGSGNASAPTCTSNCTFLQGDDRNIMVRTGSAVTSSTVTFSGAWKNDSAANITPVCTASEENAGTIGVNASSTPTTVVLEYASALTSMIVSVHCEASDAFTF